MISVFGRGRFFGGGDTAKGHQREEPKDVCENDIVVCGVTPGAWKKGYT